MFAKLLVANRGEIAVRVLRTCRRLGIASVAVYSDADARAPHVRLADEAYRLGPAPATDSYLRVERVLEAATRARAEAIHPGYGFLSENFQFAQACLDAGLVWVGPPPEAMRALGDKAGAKALAERIGVPVLAGYHGQDQDPETLAGQAEAIGYPLLLKASAGGGGRGMRVVEQPNAFGEALEAAQREALASFGDQRVLLERYVGRPRHVEVQVLGDTFGNLVHLGERECSIQRRHQKLIEESPSVVVDQRLRQAMGEAAVRLARAGGYTSAGTVEFLVDEQRRFFFLEVNARLQVEHPVTEFLTGLDLVEQQLRIAAGEQLGLSQADVALDGHAIEARVVAEDAAFLPSTGRLRAFDPPQDVRVDSGVEAGSDVSPYYDSLLAKVIAHAPTRTEAIASLAQALADFEIAGVQTNLDLLLATIQTPAFVAGELHTNFLAEHPPPEPPAEVVAAAAVDRARPRLVADPWRATGAWRIARLDQPVRLEVGGTALEVFVTRELETAQFRVLSRVRVGQQEVVAEWLSPREVRVGDELVRVGARSVEWRGRRYRVRGQPPLELEQVASAGVVGGGGGLTAPMPGRVVKLAITAGDQVHANQPLVVLEAMKMEHVVEAPHAGVVREVCVAVGQQVATGALLLELGELE